jgi:hypothetical protein
MACRTASRTVARTAESVRPREPVAPGSRRTPLSRVGGRGVGAKALVAPGAHAPAPAPAKKRSIASRLHVVESVDATECPVKGTVTSCARGKAAATATASASGVRRSAAPSRIRTGTSGRARGAAGAAAALGQPKHSGA